jgi:ABC-type multidrug transport system fused ATPase/permease subunit
MSGHAGFRPGFRYYNKWVSLFGAVIQLIIMFILSWQLALATFIVVAILYGFSVYRKVGNGRDIRLDVFYLIFAPVQSPTGAAPVRRTSTAVRYRRCSDCNAPKST